MARMNRLMLALVLCVTSVPERSAYPGLFVSVDSNSCFDEPTQPYASHLGPENDSSIDIRVMDAASRPVQSVCPGGKYPIQVTYPDARLTLLTVGGNGAALADATPGSCANRKYNFEGQAQSKSFDALLTLPCGAAVQDPSVLIRVTSATGETSAYLQNGLTLAQLPASNPACAVLCRNDTAKATLEQASMANMTAGGNPTVQVPLTEGSYNPGAQPLQQGAVSFQTTEIYMRPVISADRQTMQYVHSALMMAAFCLLMPLGVILSRHKWMFGADRKAGRVAASWFGWHVAVQLLALLCAFAGFIIAILAFGWKSVPAQPLYAPHKWMGIVITGMALLQLLISPVRPRVGARGRRAWNLVHHNWGRLTTLAGIANVFVGVVLIHDYKGESYLNWLTPAAACVGVMALLLLVLEGMKNQMERTHRYDPMSQRMYSVWEGQSVTAHRSGQEAVDAHKAALPNGQAAKAPLTVGAGARSPPVGVTASSQSGGPLAPLRTAALAPAGAPAGVSFPAVDPEAGLPWANNGSEVTPEPTYYPHVPHARS